MSKHEIRTIRYDHIHVYVTPDFINNFVSIKGSLYVISPDMLPFLESELEMQPTPVEAIYDLSRQLRRQAEEIVRRLRPEKVAVVKS